MFERTVEQFSMSNPRIKVIHEYVSDIDTMLQEVVLQCKNGAIMIVLFFHFR